MLLKIFCRLMISIYFHRACFLCHQWWLISYIIKSDLACRSIACIFFFIRSKPHYDWPLQLPSSTFLGRSSGSARRAAGVSSSRDVFAAASESDPQWSRITDASPGAIHKISSGPRSPLGSSDPRRTSSSRNTTHMKTYETTLKGIESLNFDSDEKVHY